MKTACWRKISFLSYSPKWLPANDISVFFNRQYFINRFIFDFDFWYVDRHGSKEQCFITDFLKKFSFGQMGRLDPKMAHCHNSGSAVRILLKFCIMKGANR